VEKFFISSSEHTKSLCYSIKYILVREARIMEEKRMSKRGRRKIKDLVDMLEDPENSGYIGGDYEDMMELLEQELAASEDERDQEENE
jgi:hypothetical protein